MRWIVEMTTWLSPAILPTTILTVSFGVRLAHRLSRRALELAFGVFLATVCLRFNHAILLG
jgi:uncharacterized membrane protein YfcA